MPRQDEVRPTQMELALPSRSTTSLLRERIAAQLNALATEPDPVKRRAFQTEIDRLEALAGLTSR